ncbi:MAG: leucyl aminopeptidase [Proteobacteria bacterium]|nr:leucyl aminopeptidase [Pseudomonadota bacterium]
MKFSLINESPRLIQTECLVIGVTTGGDLSASARDIEEASGGEISRMLGTGDIETGLGKTTLLHGVNGVAAQRVLVAGYGKSEKLDQPRFDRACQAAGKTLRDHALTSCHVCIHDLEFGANDPQWRLRQAALAVHRANYLYTVTKDMKDGSPAPLESASFSGDESLEAALVQAEGFALGFAKARLLGDLPPNICNPAFLAREASSIAKEYDKVELEILEEEDMAELGMDALLGVSRGSTNAAKLIVLKYSGADADHQPTVLVGKGVTFDSGGLSLKSGENMMQMKYDMCGAASVLGAFLSCAKLQLPVNLICIVAAVENMPDADAYRPGDVLTSMSGITIEVLNTDAEGRMVLCDALTYSEKFNPRVVIDVATLTGACMVALGHHASGLISNNDELAEDLLTAGNRIVDRAWRMPLWEEYQSQLDTPFADMKNVGGMSAGMLTAGCFLSRFMEDQTWAHLDIAGTAWKWGADDGATGRPSGLLTQYLIDQVTESTR